MSVPEYIKGGMNKPIFLWIALGFLLSLVLILIISTTVYVSASQFPTLKSIKEIGESFKPIVEITAIIVAGLWSYRLFIRNRMGKTHAKLTHNISHWALGGEKVYLSIITTMENDGNVLIELESGKIFIQQARPTNDELFDFIMSANDQELREGKDENVFSLARSTILWREVGYRDLHWEKEDVRIEPGETEEFQYDFILDDSVETVKVITYYRNTQVKKPEVGWRLTSMYDLKGEQNGTTERNSKKRSG